MQNLAYVQVSTDNPSKYRNQEALDEKPGPANTETVRRIEACGAAHRTQPSKSIGSITALNHLGHRATAQVPVPHRAMSAFHAVII